MASVSPSIVVIGGGPIGLWTGILAKARTNQEVLIIEKYTDYKRADINLRIQAASLTGLPNLESLKPLKKLVKEWGNKSVYIKTLEDELTKCAHDLGVKILRGKSADPKTLQQEYPTARVFIGADGARSRMRKELFNDQYKFNTPLQYIVQAQYRIKVPAENVQSSFQKVKQAITTYQRQKFSGHLITEIIKPLENGESQVTLRIFVSKKIYQQMANATFSNPYYFRKDLNKVPNKLRDILIKWWGSQNHQEIIAEADKTNKLTVIPLASYAASNAFKVSENANKEPVITVLAGDALQAFPFFRAINNGFLCATRLSSCIEKAFKALESNDAAKKEKVYTNFTAPFNSYSRYTTFRAYIEWSRAFFKNIFIILSSIWIVISDLVPWQTIKWTKVQKASFQERGLKIWHELTKPSRNPPALALQQIA